MIHANSNYILGMDRRRFEIVGIRGVRKSYSDHFVLRARLLLSPTEAGNQCNAGVIPAQVVTVHGVSKEAGSYQTYAEVGTGHGTGDIVTRR